MVRGPLVLLVLAVLLGVGTALAATSRQEGDDGVRPGPAASVLAARSPTAGATPLAPPAAPVAPRATPALTRRAAPSAMPPGGASGTAAVSRARGRPFRGSLERGVEMPVSGPDHVTWDGTTLRSPNPAWRRYGTDVLVQTVLEVLAAHRAANPGAPPVLVGDLSLPTGGVFDQRYGGLGHRSHQNGLDVDVYYPRRDRRLRQPRRASQVDRRLSQDLVDRFLAAGAELVVVGENVRLRGPRPTVIALPFHDDHLHVRIPDPDGVGPRR